MNYIAISDTHIGDSRADKNLPSLFKFLEENATENTHLILNGDLFDLIVKLGFDERHKTFIQCLRNYGKVTYICGNHDWFLYGLEDIFGQNVEFKQELVMTIGDRKFHFLHGHQVDFTFQKFPRFARWFVRFDYWLTSKIKFDLQLIFRKSRIGKWLLRLLEHKLIKKITDTKLIVAGHTHQPGITREGDVTYYNTGDWLDESHRSYVLINSDGSCELRFFTD